MCVLPFSYFTLNSSEFTIRHKNTKIITNVPRLNNFPMFSFGSLADILHKVMSIILMTMQITNHDASTAKNNSTITNSG